MDDHPLVRDGVIQLLDRQRDMSVCGEAGTAPEAKTAFERLQPDLVLLDLMLGHSDGIDLIKYFQALRPETIILVISMHEEAIFAERALRAGASGYILKQEATGEVLEAIRTVLNGKTYVSRKLGGFLSHKGLGVASPADAATTELKLTDRELHVFQLLGSGLGTRRIAEELGLSHKTIETYREHIKEKLGAASGVDVVARAKAWVEARRGPRP